MLERRTQLEAPFLSLQVVVIGQDQDRDLAQAILGADRVQESQNPVSSATVLEIMAATYRFRP